MSPFFSDRAEVGDHDNDGLPDLMVKFSRSLVGGMLALGEAAEVVVAGEADAFRISGTDTIRVIGKWKRKGQTAETIVQTVSSLSSFSNSARLGYYHLDHLGTPQVLTNEAGEVVWSADYLPFGEVNVIVDSVKNDFRFPGQYYDSETGLHYNYHSYYDPMSGRYLTPDPIGLLNANNLFIYVDLDPINFDDPLGLFNSERVFWGFVEASAGGLGIGLAAETEYFSTGTATVAAIGLAGISIPALGHGISEIIAGGLENESNKIPQIPQVSAPSLSFLATTGDVEKANRADLITNMILLGSNVGKMATGVSKYVKWELLEKVINFGNIAYQAPKIIPKPSESECNKR